jgi:uncharacterized iron-regulated membrane protein
MKITVLNRKVHYWGSVIITIPLLLVIGTGILLLLKKDISWIQPATIKGKGKVPVIGFDQLYNSAKKVKQAGIGSWEDISRIDIQPSKGIAKITTSNHFEVQMDLQTSEVLQVAYRRSDLIESLHDGTFFHDKAKYLLSLPTAIILFVLLVTGIVLFIQPYYVKYNRNRKRIKKRSFNA